MLDLENYIVDERNEEIILHRKGVSLRKLYLEPTSRCNLKCITCVRQQWPNLTQDDMDMELFERLLEQMKAFPALELVHLGGFGEPLAHPQALEMIRRLRQAGYRVSLNTNGSLVTTEVARELISCGLHAIYFSIDGLDEELFSKIRVNGHLNEVVENIFNLRRLKQEAKSNYPKIGLEFVLMRSNIDQLPLLKKLAREVGAPTVLISNLLPYSEEMYQEVLFESPGKKRELGAGALAPLNWNGLAKDFRFPEPATWPAIEPDYVLFGTIRLPRMYWGSSRRCGFVEDSAAVIRWDGAVAPCYALLYAYDYYLDNRKKEVSAHHFGTIDQESLAEIWNKPEYVKFRYRVRNFNFPSCMDCSTNKSCDYTDANEDCWGNAPSCADCLWSQGIVRCP